MKRKIFYAILISFASLLVINTALEAKNTVSTERIPPDPAIIINTLDNGLTYYIKENRKPENRAELQIIIYAGSILETDEQAGLAHFLEHMAFNGTKNFPKHELVDFLESTGMKFGADLNASTGFDRTYYLLTIPLDSADLLPKGMQVLFDWADNILLEEEEIEKERGVIMEEWRLYLGAQERLRKKHFPVILKGSKYAERLPIGDTAVIQNAPRSEFVKFYEDWYRPNLSAIIAVGDFDKNEIEKMIREKFSKWKNPPNAPERKEYDVPANEDIRISIAKDKELPTPTMVAYYSYPAPVEGTYQNYRNKIINNLMAQMLMQRFNELRRKSDPPFMFAFAGADRFLGDKHAFNLVAATKTDGLLDGIDAAVRETFRAYQHGFLDSELERVKKEYLRTIEKAFNEREKTESKNYAFEYSRHFLHGEAIPGIEKELELTKQYLPGITIEEVNETLNGFMANAKPVITISAPDKEDVVIPSEDEVIAAFTKYETQELEPYEEQVSGDPLFDKEVEPGKIVDEKVHKDLGITELKLSNGARVLTKSTDFKNDQIVFRAYSVGGYSKASDEDYLSAERAADIIEDAGVSKFELTELEKMLAGKIVRVSPFIGELTEGLRGDATPEDLETMMQLINLYFTEPRMDYDAFENYMTRLRESVMNSKVVPSSALRDTFYTVLSNYHYRERPMNEEMLEDIELEAAYDFYRNRFADASDFTFIFVGNIDIEKMKPMIEKYIGSLPTVQRDDKWVDLGIEPPKGQIIKKIKKGMEPQSTVMIAITGDYNWDPMNNLQMQAMIEVLNIKLRENIREEKGGAYGVGASARPEKYPDEEYMITFYLPTDPERVDELVGDIKNIIKEMKTEEVESTYVKKAKEIMLRQYEENMKRNEYWVNEIYQKDFYGQNLTGILDYDKMVNKLDAAMIKEAANRYLDLSNWIQVVLYPEDDHSKK